MHATVAPPQLARHLRSGEAVVPRQFGYAAQQPPFTNDAVQSSPDAHTRVPASPGPASSPASREPASKAPASGTPASGSGTPASWVPASSSEPASSPASLGGSPPSRVVQRPLEQRSSTPHTAQVPLVPHASSEFPGRQLEPWVQPLHPLGALTQRPSWHCCPAKHVAHWVPPVPQKTGPVPSSQKPSTVQQPAQFARQSSTMVGPHAESVRESEKSRAIERISTRTPVAGRSRKESLKAPPPRQPKPCWPRRAAARRTSAPRRRR